MCIVGWKYRDLNELGTRNVYFIFTIEFNSYVVFEGERSRKVDLFSDHHKIQNANRARAVVDRR